MLWLSLVPFAKLHYFSENGSTTGGIMEFMNPHFYKSFHKELLNIDSSAWHKYPYVEKVACHPQHKILAATRVTHVDAFIVDVEGGELALLKSVDWSTTTFDVVAVETEEWYRYPGYVKDVTAFMTGKGYVSLGDKGRNTWFKRADFVLSTKP